jgi:hypothetical protein
MVLYGGILLDAPKIYIETTIFNFPFVPDIPGYAELKTRTIV